MSPLFSGAGDQAPYTADISNRENGLIYEMNTPRSAGAKESSRMDFSHPDQAPSAQLNAILWRDAMGDKPLPPQLLHPVKGSRRKDDDD